MSIQKFTSRPGRAHEPNQTSQTVGVQLTDLPKEILTDILGRTSGGTVLRMAPSSKVFHQIAREDHVWQQMQDNGVWKPAAGVSDIIAAGAYRDAYQVQVMEKKALWDKVSGRAQVLTAELRKQAFHAPVPRGGCTFGVTPAVAGQRLLQQQIRSNENQRRGITSELIGEGLTVTDKGWKRQWG